MAGAHAGAGIKLFGATITLQDQQDKTHIPNKKIDNNDIQGAEQGSQREEPKRVIACPRCKSMETKFCYFNNYNVNQPRHFCKGCQRYWTAGGALRNVPVGAGRRKVKPPCREMIGVEGFDLWDGGLEDWGVAAVHGGFQRVFPVKRRRVENSGD